MWRRKIVIAESKRTFHKPHPAARAGVIVNRGAVAGLPGKHNKLVEIVFTHQISAVSVFAEERIWRKRVRFERAVFEKTTRGVTLKFFWALFVQEGEKFLKFDRIHSASSKVSTDFLGVETPLHFNEEKNG